MFDLIMVIMIFALFPVMIIINIMKFGTKKECIKDNYNLSHIIEGLWLITIVMSCVSLCFGSNVSSDSSSDGYGFIIFMFAVMVVGMLNCFPYWFNRVMFKPEYQIKQDKAVDYFITPMFFISLLYIIGYELVVCF